MNTASRSEKDEVVFPKSTTETDSSHQLCSDNQLNSKESVVSLAPGDNCIRTTQSDHTELGSHAVEAVLDKNPPSATSDQLKLDESRNSSTLFAHQSETERHRESPINISHGITNQTHGASKFEPATFSNYHSVTPAEHIDSSSVPPCPGHLPYYQPIRRECFYHTAPETDSHYSYDDRVQIAAGVLLDNQTQHYAFGPADLATRSCPVHGTERFVSPGGEYVVKSHVPGSAPLYSGGHPLCYRQYLPPSHHLQQGPTVTSGCQPHPGPGAAPYPVQGISSGPPVQFRGGGSYPVHYRQGGACCAAVAPPLCGAPHSQLYETCQHYHGGPINTGDEYAYAMSTAATQLRGFGKYQPHPCSIAGAGFGSTEEEQYEAERIKQEMACHVASLAQIDPRYSIGQGGLLPSHELKTEECCTGGEGEGDAVAHTGQGKMCEVHEQSVLADMAEVNQSFRRMSTDARLYEEGDCLAIRASGSTHPSLGKDSDLSNLSSCGLNPAIDTIQHSDDGSSVDYCQPDHSSTSTADGTHQHRLTMPSHPAVRSHTPPERDTNCRTTSANLAAATPPAPASMAFTINFGTDEDQPPEITDRWKQLTPYRIHTGIALRSSEQQQRSRVKAQRMMGSNSESLDVNGSNRRHGSNGQRHMKRDAGNGTGSPSSRSVDEGRGGGGGYMSDGHGSGDASSDNEDTSISSDVVGIKRGRPFDVRKRFSQPTPSRSQPSLLTKSKPPLTAAPATKHASAAATSSSSSPSKQTVRARVPSTSSCNSAKPSASTRPPINRGSSSPSTREVSKKSTLAAHSNARDSPRRTDDGFSKAPHSRNGKSKTYVPSAPKGKEKRVDIEKIIAAHHDDPVDVTTYLINRMLGPSEPSPAIGQCRTRAKKTPPIGDIFAEADKYCRQAASIIATAKPILPSESELKRMRRKSGGTGGGGEVEDAADNVSETGTYTIDDDDEDPGGEVLAARKNIDVVFGIRDSGDVHSGSQVIVRPVIDEEEERRKEDMKEQRGNVPLSTDEEVFEAEGEFVDYGLQNKYKRQIEQAVSTGLSAHQAIQEALKALQQSQCLDAPLHSALPSDSTPSTFDQQVPVGSLPPVLDSNTQSEDPPLSAGSGRQCATVCDDGNFGTFTISFDAPASAVRSLSRNTTPDITKAEASSPSLLPNKRKIESQRSDEPLSSNRSVTHAVDTDQELEKIIPSTLCNETSASIPSNQQFQSPIRQQAPASPVSPSVLLSPSSMHTVGLSISPSATRSPGVARRLAKISEAAPLAQELKLAPKLGNTHAAAATAWNPWSNEDMSDAGSECESNSSYVNYSTQSSPKLSRSTRIARLPSNSSIVVPGTRTNRTFALRCAKISGNETELSRFKAPRSRSVGTDVTAAALTGRSAGTPRLTAVDRSNIKSNRSPVGGSRGGGESHPLNNIGSKKEVGCYGGSSSTSLSSTMSTNDGSSFVRRDGGRFSMRMTDRFIPPGTADVSVRGVKPKSAGAQTKQRGQPMSSSNERRGGSTPAVVGDQKQSKQMSSWARRMEYQPVRPAVASSTTGGKSKWLKGQDTRYGTGHGGGGRGGNQMGNIPSHQQKVLDAVRSEEIAKLSHAVAHNLNVLSQSTRKDSVLLDMLEPVVISEEFTRPSAFSVPHLRTDSKSQSNPIVSSYSLSSSSLNSPSWQSEDNAAASKNSCDAVLVESIQHVSRKVKSLTDRLIDKVRDDGGQSTLSPLDDLVSSPPGGTSGGATASFSAWEKASPELAAILENLKRTEQHLQVVHKALFSTDNAGQQSTYEQQRVLAELSGFRSVAMAMNDNEECNESKMSAAQVTNDSPSSNPLSGDEYY